MNSKLKSDLMDKLFEAVLTLESVDECYDFFEDLCTIQELKVISQRFKVAGMLLEKRVYSDIANETGVSTATISRVNRSLNFGSDGYKAVYSKLKEQ